jgi:hypothetical protein
MFTSIIGAAGLTALIVGLGFLLAKFSGSSVDFKTDLHIHGAP